MGRLRAFKIFRAKNTETGREVVGSGGTRITGYLPGSNCSATASGPISSVGESFRSPNFSAYHREVVATSRTATYIGSGTTRTDANDRLGFTLLSKRYLLFTQLYTRPVPPYTEKTAKRQWRLAITPTTAVPYSTQQSTTNQGINGFIDTFPYSERMNSSPHNTNGVSMIAIIGNEATCMIRQPLSGDRQVARRGFSLCLPFGKIRICCQVCDDFSAVARKYGPSMGQPVLQKIICLARLKFCFKSAVVVIRL